MTILKLPSRASRMSREQAVDYLDGIEANPFKPRATCEHGHIHCAATEGGPCSDELHSRFPSIVDGE